MAVWDSVQDPPLLDACLYMCPSFKHVPQVGFTCHSWWKCTPYYDLRKCLNVELDSSGKFLMSGFSQGVKKGRFFQQENEGCNSGFCFGYTSICVENHVATDGPFFYSNDDYFVKVYCIGLINHFQKDRSSISRARRAFHDASATSYFCEKNDWFYKSFGLICFGLATPCCFVCIARKTLEAANVENPPPIGSLCVDVTKRTKSMHGDVHLSNVLWNPVTCKFELVDCERAIRLKSEGPSAWFYNWYASSVASRKHLEIEIIMDKLKHSGLEGTSEFFSQMYLKRDFLRMAVDSKLFEQCPEFEWTYDPFLHLMELLSEEALTNKDPTPVLQNSHGTCIISCHIRPHFSRDCAAFCQIHYQRSGSSSIKICSALFQHKSEICLQKNFEQCQDSFNLENEANVLRFFDFALSMKAVYGDTSDDSDDYNDDSPVQVSLGKQIRVPGAVVDINKKSKSRSTVLEKVGWPSWLYEILRDECGDQDVVDSIRRSMMVRFGHCGSLSSLNISPKSEPLNTLRPEHFGCEVVLVNDAAGCERCLNFVGNESHLSFDTESTVPKKKGEGICLIQIGTTTNVFIIQVAIQSKAFLSSLTCCLNDQKTLICWGDDEKALKAVLPSISCKFKDLQKKFSTHERKKGIGICVEELFDHRYVLSKTWRLSGWDNMKLTKGQIRYASLDVIACHALFLSDLPKPKPVYESRGVHITFYATDSSTESSKFRHGFCFTPSFLGHYKNDVVVSGFAFDSSSQGAPRLTGFRAFGDTFHRVAEVNVDQFLILLNDFKFCCSLCSGSWFFQKEWRFFSDASRTSFSCIKSSKSAVVRSSVQCCSNKDELDALYCLSMVASFFRMSPSVGTNLQSLKKSVCHDIHYGYIFETLAHLT
jgi:hypothetical protein